VVDIDGEHQFVAVDIPGLIEGAHVGKGLGYRFLRHVERTRVLLHLIDLAKLEGRDPLRDYQRINEELAAFSPALATRPQIVVGNKIDLLDQSDVEEEKARFSEIGVELFPISVATGSGVRNIVMRAYSILQSLTVVASDEGEIVQRRVYRYHGEEGFRVERDGDLYVVRGAAVERLVGKLILDSRDAREYLSERLEKMGVLRELNRQGFEHGDLVRIGEVQLELSR